MEREFWKAGNMLYPVPAVMISSMRPGECPNIITVAWAGTICSDPAMVSISVRKERYSYDIIRETGARMMRSGKTRDIHRHGCITREETSTIWNIGSIIM